MCYDSIIKKRQGEIQGAFLLQNGYFNIPGGDMKEKNKRPDQNGTHRGAFEKNKKRIYATQSVCGICGMPVDFEKKHPHPLSPCIDHIIPIAKGGHPSDISNLQLAHWICNRQKSDHMPYMNERKEGETQEIGNQTLPWSLDWEKYRAE